MSACMKNTAMLATCAAAALAVAATAQTAVSQTIVSRGQSFISTSLVPGAVEAGGHRMMGLSLDMADGWKTYWRAPGEAGIPPRIDWSASQNVADVKVHWPTPGIYENFGLTTIGYSDQVLLPVEVTPEDPSKPIVMDLAMELGVCRDICVFEAAEVRMSLPPDLSAGVAQITAALDQMPLDPEAAGLSSAACRILGNGSERRFEATLDFEDPAPDAMVLIEGPDGAWFHQIDSHIEDGDLHVASALTLLFEDVWVTRKDIRMTLLAGDWAVDVQGCTAPAG